MSEVLSTVSTYIVPIIVVVVSGVISFFTSQSISKRQLTVEYKTSKRIEWIYEVRKIASEFIAYSLDLFNYVQENQDKEIKLEEKTKTYFQINLRAVQLKLFFNPEDEKDAEIIHQIDKVVGILAIIGEKNCLEKVSSSLNLLQTDISKYLKDEWERCKKEIEGKSLKKGTRKQTKLTNEVSLSKSSRLFDKIRERYSFAKKYDTYYKQECGKVFQRSKKQVVKKVVEGVLVVMALICITVALILLAMYKSYFKALICDVSGIVLLLIVYLMNFFWLNSYKYEDKMYNAIETTLIKVFPKYKNCSKLEKLSYISIADKEYNTVFNDVSIIFRRIASFTIQILSILLGVYSNLIEWKEISSTRLVLWIVVLIVLYLLGLFLSDTKIFLDIQKKNIRAFREGYIRKNCLWYDGVECNTEDAGCENTSVD